MKSFEWKYPNLFLSKFKIMKIKSNLKSVSFRDVLKAEFIEDDGHIVFAVYPQENLKFMYVKDSGILVVIKK